ncbi:HpcH/HpaI aldolase/citrate lyase family protein [Pseudonocardia sp. GCM10023141]|uniref:HpcH/HpaI aldolase/citrate lyase family protein n=1 Tax=Pseudonocardia sp. GCM10023141 TaxID=3252653 RepID=UPI003609E7E4
MRHFDYFTAPESAALFELPPEQIPRNSGIELLSVALGATLYMPADRPSLAADITKQAAAGATSVVVCLEDSIADESVAEAECNLVDAVQMLHAGEFPADALPLLFIRVREPAQIPALVTRLGAAVRVIDGFVLPKFSSASGPEYLRALDFADRSAGTTLLAMPVLESGAVLYAETRAAELSRLRILFDAERHRILALRLGATDLCALYGLRRSPELSIYDIKVVADLIGDIVNALGRADGTGFTITGPVWEYFAAPERMFKPQLRRSPFDEHNEPELRGRLVLRAIDGLIREIQLDKANGLTGKTTIHPSHVAVVNALSVVSLEEYRDASDVLSAGRGSGVLASVHGNKMNEIRPHSAWATATLRRSRVFGVAADGVSFVDLLAASLPR